jgi:multiple sugar transport system permease protein
LSSLQRTAPGGSVTASAGAAAPRKPGRLGPHWWSTRVLPLVPAVTMLVVFLAFPIVWSFYSSFTNIALTGSRAANPEFIGLGNYGRLLEDPVFPRSVWLTVVFVLFSAILGQNILGLFLALIMRTAGRTVTVLTSTVIIVAWILPEIVAAFAMYAFFVGDGTLNQILAVVGIEGPSWLFAHPMVAVIVANTWRGTAFSMMIYQAALSSVPPEVGEAARIDGATTLRELFSITLPMIRNSIATNLMLITLQTLSVFTIVFVMTAGGPSNRSMILPVYAYDQAFGFLDIGYGSAIATVMLLVGVVFGLIYVRLLRPGRD